MSKILTLKPRLKHGNTYTWHDLFVLQMSLNHIATGKTIAKVGMWLNIAGKLQYAQAEVDLGPKSLDQEVSIELRNIEAKKWCEELKKLKPEHFGQDQMGHPSAPPLGALWEMLTDIGSQLGFTIVVESDDDDDDD